MLRHEQKNDIRTNCSDPLHVAGCALFLKTRIARSYYTESIVHVPAPTPLGDSWSQAPVSPPAPASPPRTATGGTTVHADAVSALAHVGTSNGDSGSEQSRFASTQRAPSLQSRSHTGTMEHADAASALSHVGTSNGDSGSEQSRFASTQRAPSLQSRSHTETQS